MAMTALVILTSLALVASISVTRGHRSRAEAVIAASLVFNALIVGPIYVLGLAGRLDRLSLGALSVALSVGTIALGTRRAMRRSPTSFGLVELLRELARRTLSLAALPLEAIARTWQRRTLSIIGAVAATALVPYMLLVAYLAPAWRDWDGLWYHEPLTGFTIQNHGFAPVPLPTGLQVINGVQRLCEMTQTWFAIWGGRRVVDLANVVFMPLLAASMFALARRYTKDVVTAVAWASALVLFPGYVRLLQSTMVDPQACALLLAAAYFATHPDLDRRTAFFAILAMTLAVGAKIWSIVPIGLLSLVMVYRLVQDRRKLGTKTTLGLIAFGTVALVGMQAITYVRNWLNFGNPLWPMIQYDNDKLGIHWKGLIAVGGSTSGFKVDFNDPFPVFYEKLLAPPFTVMGPGHTWQINDYGFAFAWVVFPLCFVAIIVLSLRWISNLFGGRLRRRSRVLADPSVSGALILAIVGGVSLYLSPALHIPRYHVASVGMLCTSICWLSGRRTGSRLALGAAIIAQVGSILMLAWAPQKAPFVSIYAPKHVLHWLKTPYPARELDDIGTKEVPKMLISPVFPATGRAREKEIGPGDVVAFEQIDFVALLWNNAYSNKVVWLDGGDPLEAANRVSAKWVYARPGTRLASELAHAKGEWERVGPLEAEHFGDIWRRKQR